MKYFGLVLVLFISIVTKAQIAVNTGVNVNDLVTAISGQGVIITNATLNCPTGAFATFSGGSGNLGLPSGILLTTGSAVNGVGPNNTGGLGACNNTSSNDPDLIAIESGATLDVCILEFDVVPQCDVLTLNYVFGSEEYPEYVCGNVNDAFGFFLSGPNPGGGNYSSTNVALIPGTTTPVSINTVNNGTSGINGTASNCAASDPLWNTHAAYYVNNAGGSSTQYKTVAR